MIAPPSNIPPTKVDGVLVNVETGEVDLSTAGPTAPSNIPPPTFIKDIPQNPPPPTGESVDFVLKPFSLPVNKVRVNFTNEGLRDILSLEDPGPFFRNVPVKQLKDSLDVLDTINFEKTNKVGFTSIPELAGLDYVGYIINKERFDMATQTWIRTEETKIVGSNVNVYKDANVAYGQKYRYQIKSVVKVTLPIPLEGNSPTDLKYEFKSYYYESETCKDWTEIEVRDTEAPPPPSAIKIIPSTPNKRITITWLPPVSNQRDVKFVRLYKRRNIDQPWNLVDIKTGNVLPIIPETTREQKNKANIDLSVNYYEDVLSSLDVEQDNTKWIYAMTSVDVHGIESVLSMQMEAGLNSKYAVERREKNIKYVSGMGAFPLEVGMIYKKFQKPEAPIIAKEGKITLKPSIFMKEAEKNLIMRVTSLDTGEIKEFKVVLKNVKMTK